jgi:hypothetical protein
MQAATHTLAIFGSSFSCPESILIPNAEPKAVTKVRPRRLGFRTLELAQFAWKTETGMDQLSRHV